MVEHNRAFGGSSAEIFAEAVERIQAGESLEVVLASYPPEYRSNLHSLLAVVIKAQEIHQAPVPLPSASRRVAHRQSFLQAVAEKRTEQALIEAARPTPVAIAEGKRSFWTAFLEAFTVRPMRLAPVALMLTILLLGTTSLVTLAQESVPGDPVYPIKQWIRQQELYLSPPEQRAMVRQEQEEELVEDVRVATTRIDLRRTVIEVEGVMLFHGYGAGYLHIGGLRVLPHYEPDPNKSDTVAMDVAGDLEPGKIVRLLYRMLPGQAGSPVPMVQGVRLTVIEQQPVEPTPLPTATPTIPPNCVAQLPSGWLPTNVRPGDSLASLAGRRGVSLEELRLVNCLASEEISERDVLLLPPTRNRPDPEDTPQASPTATIAPTPTDTATFTTIITATVISPPTATSSVTETVPAPATATHQETVTPPIVYTATVIMPPGETAWASVTPTAGSPITSTQAATPTITVAPVEPVTPATVWPTVTPTSGQPVTATQEATLTPTASPDAFLTPATAVVTVTATLEATETPVETEAAPPITPEASSTPTSAATAGATPDMTETPTVQVTGSATLEQTPGATAPDTAVTPTPDSLPTLLPTETPAEVEATPPPTSVSPPTSIAPPTITPLPTPTSVSPPTSAPPLEERVTEEASAAGAFAGADTEPA